jgi:hypothetical protein
VLYTSSSSRTRIKTTNRHTQQFIWRSLDLKTSVMELPYVCFRIRKPWYKPWIGLMLFKLHEVLEAL